MFDPGLKAFVGPTVVCVRGPSRSGKTAVCERIIRQLAPETRVAYLKRTHHELDLPAKASGRIWTAGPAAMALRATDRMQITVSAGDGSAGSLIEALPTDIDLILLETHEREPFPTILATALEPAEGEAIIGRFTFETMDADAASAAAAIKQLAPADRQLDHALRAAMRVHGGHCCAGLVLGTRLALTAVAELGVEVPDRHKRLIVTVETDRCAVDAVQAVTGCRPGKRTLRLLDYGKLAATFFDESTGRAVRVATRGDLRERVAVAPGQEPHEAQRLAYLSMEPAELFTMRAVAFAVEQFDRPGPPRRRVLCTACGEEVSDGRDVNADSGPVCRPCAESPNVLPNDQGRVPGWR
jgi:formylmethanofuran dehydrogenase subunit E